MQRAVSGVCSAGLSITTLPQARAGASFTAAMLRGKFQAVIAPTIPTGSRLVYTKYGPSAKYKADSSGV